METATLTLDEKIKLIKKIAPKTVQRVRNEGWTDHFICMIAREVDLSKNTFEQLLSGRIVTGKDTLSWVGEVEADGKTYALVFREA